ncbi:cupin domain-containing protein [Halobacillus litoralis]|uniref:cupin domain-containing protein n=1 Tax=Halobacillus litoralis TaxID=45668 RepID=UPI001CD22DC3|nr:cupin domain-containing protein [Halobacillus litoralis]MCA1022198.1 cupin domain-containing protein [Halobacillus litoralis]
MYPYPSMNRQQAADMLQNSIASKASAAHLYQRLFPYAPAADQPAIRQAFEKESAMLHEQSLLYTQVTGKQPSFQAAPPSFRSYQDGLQKAYEMKLDHYNYDQQAYRALQGSSCQSCFQRACQSNADEAGQWYELLKRQEDPASTMDFGGQPFVLDIEKATVNNDTFRTAVWTGDHLQVTLMSIGVGEDIGLEIHPDVDQFLRLEQGRGRVQIGPEKDQLTFEREVSDDDAIMIPAGVWHNVTNTGDVPMKLYSIYAPPEHPFGTVHNTKADALAAEAEE